MAEITSSTTLEELAAIISQALEAAGILATLSGGAAVSIYTNNRYQSEDLDFVSSAAAGKLAKDVESLGFVPTKSQRLFAHTQTPWLLEFPAGPLAFGETIVNASGIDDRYGRGPSPCDHSYALCIDRLAAFVHWNDRSATTRRSGLPRVKSSIGQIWKRGQPMRGWQRIIGCYLAKHRYPF
jgi:hypothetical protein